ncbi:hypothetical protein L9F63_017731 [Diploptera punctata]|uniref:Uncharacterized protein n=1 Tax=Diploptera punctata TaxID=6984 RepID=A0AAD8EG96_DIPPU|nr:hypothetical protein L9F63_017731 [Diploptera punctata]
MIRNIAEKCDGQSKQNSLRFPLKEATKRTADYCGKSENSIIKIRKEKLKELTEEAIETITDEDWNGYCKKVDEETKYWENDGIVSDVIDSIIVNLGSGSYSDSDNCEVSSSGTNCDSDDDYELSRPL